MKGNQYWITVLILWTCQFANGQTFEIPIYFEDSVGDKDSIVLGYNVLASYGIDSDLGEIDLIDSAYADDFEVRAAIYGYSWELGDLPRIIESKKMIIDYICFDSTYFNEANSIMVVIKCQYWPITITWNKSIFQESCNYIDIIDCTAGGWFDACGGGHPYLKLEMSQVESAEYYDTEFKIETEDETLNALFFSFFNEIISNTSLIPNETRIEVTPNPTNGLVYLNYPLTNEDRISILDISGRSIPFLQSFNELDLTGAPDGMYILAAKLHTGKLLVTKIFKKSS